MYVQYVRYTCQILTFTHTRACGSFCKLEALKKKLPVDMDSLLKAVLVPVTMSMEEIEEFRLYAASNAQRLRRDRDQAREDYQKSVDE